MFDYLIVGAGFAGSVLAERLANVGKKVLLIDRRTHMGGNAYDYFDEAGILVHKYGPHIFHTNSVEVFGYLSRFTQWRDYQHRVLASVDGQLLPIPINGTTINKLYDKDYNEAWLIKFFRSVAEPNREVHNSEDVVIRAVGRELYEKFFRGYTRKQWGMDPSELDPSVCARIPTRTNFDDRYFTDTFQAMPAQGYTRLFENMLDHPNIELALNTSLEDARRVPHTRTIFTGPVDEFFGHRFGKLPYRSLEFRRETYQTEQFQAVGQINFPNDHEYTRITEFKHLTGQSHAQTSVAFEYPRAEGDPYYPIPCQANRDLYGKYLSLAESTTNVFFVGRMATYRYYNMDQVIASALTLFRKLEKA